MEHYDIPEYWSTIGSLIYMSIGTQPDISFAVQHLSQFMSNPAPAHWTAVKQVFWFLNSTCSLGILYHKGGEVEPLAYSDADWGSDVNNHKSISGYIFQMSAGPISWQSKKRPTIALSSMEAKYMAKSLATQQTIWLWSLTAKLSIPYSRPTTVPFLIFQPSHITDPLSMAEISYFSQVMLRVATGQKCHSISILVYFSTGIFFLYKMNKMQLLGLIILLSSIICIIMMPEVIDIKAVGLFTAGRCWILGGKQGLMLNGLLKCYSQKQPARLGTVKLVKWLKKNSHFQLEDEPLLS